MVLGSIQDLTVLIDAKSPIAGRLFERSEELPPIAHEDYAVLYAISISK